MSGDVLEFARGGASTTVDPGRAGPDPAAAPPPAAASRDRTDTPTRCSPRPTRRPATRSGADEPEPPAAGAAPAGGPAQAGQRFGGVFVEAPGGLFREAARKDETVRQELTNFWARIVAEVVVDDGAERATFYEIEAQVRRPRGPRLTFAVPAAEFAALGWVDTHLGALAVVAAGAGNRLVATAVKERGIAAGTVARREVFAHLGWRQVDGRWAYLHGGGALGAEGPVEGVEVRPPARLGRYGIATGDAAAGMRASLRLLLLAPARVTVPLWAAVWRAPFGDCESVLWLAGRTGRVQVRARRAGAAALRAAAWTPGTSRRAGPAPRTTSRPACSRPRTRSRWSTTSRRASPAAAGRSWRRRPSGSCAGSATRPGRGRMTADGRQRPDRPPRAQVIVTGEDLPAAHSIRARSLVVPVAEGDVDTARLTAAQADAAAGLYERALAGFLVWLAGRYAAAVERWRGLAAEYRARLVAKGVHGRSPAALGQLLAAVEVLAEHLGGAGVEVPAASVLDHLGGEVDVGASGLTRRVAGVLAAALDEQAEQQRGADPVRLFVEGLVRGAGERPGARARGRGAGRARPSRRAARLAAGRGGLGRGAARGVAGARRSTWAGSRAGTST